jgi:deazaflavin-dependent oxidoreductase (nitroreductase family)
MKTEMVAGAEISKKVGSAHVPRIVPVLNHLTRSFLRLGVPMGPVGLLTVKGRVTGKSRRSPVGLFKHNGRRYLFSTFGEVNWVRNLRAAGQATVRRGFHKTEVFPVELTPEEAAPILKESIAPFLKNRFAEIILGPHFKVKHDAPLSDFLTEARRHPVFELRETESK